MNGLARAIISASTKTRQVVRLIAQRVMAVVAMAFIGAIIGAPTGFVGWGDGKSGSLVFGIFGAILGFFVVPDLKWLLNKIRWRKT
ncbi:MAG: hypothetical protein ACPGGK_13110 [Pikeienuella sp.]